MRLNRNPLASALALTTILLAGCGLNPSNGAGFGASNVGGSFGAAAVISDEASAHHKSAAGDKQLYVLPDATDSFLLQAVHNAKKSVRVEVYMLTNKDLIAELEAANARGVAVQVLLEARPYNPNNPNNPLPTNIVTAKKLAAAGIAVVWTSPDFVYTHAKFLIVDDQTAFVSTANFTGTGLQANREYVVADQTPADVAQLVSLYQADYAHSPFQLNDPSLVLSPVNSRAQIMNLIKSATKTIQLADEIAADPAIDALIAAKLKQGVQVVALLAAPPKPIPGQNPYPNIATAATWIAAGAQVRYQKAPYLHAKEIIVDNARMYVGSVNLSTNSMDANREVGLIVTDPSLIQPVAGAAARDWQTALPVTPGAIPAQALVQRLGMVAPPELQIDD